MAATDTANASLGSAGVAPPGQPLPRQLVVCCDGTNNTLTAGAADTNVLLLHRYLGRHAAPAGVERVLYYDPGVGSPDAVPPTDPIDWGRRSLRRVSAMASGRGVYENIAEAYLFLMRHWRDENDRIYCFGFSRGAFTVRCVVGMVNLFGILKPQHEPLLPTLVHIYFSLPSGRGSPLQRATRWIYQASAKRQKAAAEPGGHTETDDRANLARQVQELFTSEQGRQAWVHWVGVWDTVESVGLPGPLSRSNPSTANLARKRIRHVRHALALDEHRWTFEPRLYEEPGDIEDGSRSLRQRWFPGVHCDVGGSYRAEEAGLSDESLCWMVNEVARDIGVPQLQPAGRLRRRHDSLWDTPWWALAGMSLRDMRPMTANGQPIAVIAAPVAAAVPASVWQQRRGVRPLAISLVAGVLCLWFSGLCLSPSASGGAGLAAAAAQASGFAWEQLAALWGAGLLAPGRAPWLSGAQPGWAMAWDFGFIAAWGYVLARICSRAFAWLAGARRPGSGMPAWRWLGMAPLAAVGGDVSENLCTLAAMAVHGAGVESLAQGLLWLGGVAASVKCLGLAACLPLLLVRAWIVVGSARQRRESPA